MKLKNTWFVQTCIVVIPISSLLSRLKRTESFFASSLKRIPPSFNGSASSCVVSNGNDEPSPTSDDIMSGLLNRTKGGRRSGRIELLYNASFDGKKHPPIVTNAKTVGRILLHDSILNCSNFTAGPNKRMHSSANGATQSYIKNEQTNDTLFGAHRSAAI